MSDKQQLIDMLTRARIEFQEIEPEFVPKRATSGINVERGYAGFVTTFEFDAAGNLVEMGAYE